MKIPAPFVNLIKKTYPNWIIALIIISYAVLILNLSSTIQTKMLYVREENKEISEYNSHINEAKSQYFKELNQDRDRLNILGKKIEDSECALKKANIFNRFDGPSEVLSDCIRYDELKKDLFFKELSEPQEKSLLPPVAYEYDIYEALGSAILLLLIPIILKILWIVLTSIHKKIKSIHSKIEGIWKQLSVFQGLIVIIGAIIALSLLIIAITLAL